MEPQKLSNTSIILTSFSQSFDDIVEILVKCSEDLTVEQLSKLITAIPSDEDRKKLVDYKDNLDKLMNVEKFLKKFIAIPRLKQRLESMIFKKNHSGDHQHAMITAEELNEPFIVLKSCTKFQNVLKFILETFNYLNHGTNKANQAGFTLDALNSLESLKAFDKVTSMMTFIVENIRVNIYT